MWLCQRSTPKTSNFISEFEQATATLPENQRLKVLVKAFPPGRAHTWYETHLDHLVRSRRPWSAIKQKIIERYSVTEDRNRHFHRLNEMMFVDNGSQKLFDYVEDLIYSLDKAMPKLDDGTKIRFIKARLPSAIKSSLSLISDYVSAQDMTQLLKGVRRFDTLRLSYRDGSASPKRDESEKIKSSDMIKLVQELIKSVQQEGKATRESVAALSSRSRDRTLPRNYRQQHFPSRDKTPLNSPVKSISSYSGRTQRDPSPRPRSIERGRSPYKYNNYHSYRQTPNVNPIKGQGQNYSTNIQYDDQGYRPKTPLTSRAINMQAKDSHHQQRSDSPNTATTSAFGDEQYFQKFGKPKMPCRCGYYHYYRHCPESLNWIGHLRQSHLLVLITLKLIKQSSAYWRISLTYFQPSSTLTARLIRSWLTQVPPYLAFLNTVILCETHHKIENANLRIELATGTIEHVDKKITAHISPIKSHSKPRPVTLYVQNGSKDIFGFQALIGLRQLKLFELQIDIRDGKIHIYHQGQLIGSESPVLEQVQASVRIVDNINQYQAQDNIQRILNKYKQVFTDLDAKPLQGPFVPPRFGFYSRSGSTDTARCPLMRSATGQPTIRP